MNNKILLSFLIIPTFFVSCTTTSNIKTLKKGDAMQSAITELGEDPSVIKVEVPSTSFQIKEIHGVIPDAINHDIDVSFKTIDTRIFIEHLSRVLKINIISEITNTQNQKSVNINFSGKLENLFYVLSESLGYFFVYKNGSIIVKEDDVFSVHVPSHFELLKEVEKSISQLGATGIAYDNLTSSIVFRANYTSINRIKGYLEKLKENAALITMRIVLVNVRISGEKNLGIDWTKFTYNYGSKNTGTAANSGIGGASISLTNTGASFIFEDKNFLLSTFLDFLESYGKYNIVQNIFIETVNGKTGKIDVSTETPYIKNISIAPYNVSSSSAASASILSSTQSDVAKTGIVLEVTPNYNAETKIISVMLDAGVFGVTRFINLNAGQAGTLTQPEITKKTVKTYLRMKSDQIVVVGGLTLDKSADNIIGLPGDSYFSKTQQKKNEREELVIIVKPAIIEFVSNNDQK